MVRNGANRILIDHGHSGLLGLKFAALARRPSFDTTVGGKREAESYRKIAAAINLPPQDILFLSDIKEELDAATTAGMQTVWLVRDGAIDARAAHRQVRDFNSIEI